MKTLDEDLVPVHGGLAEPVDRVVPLKERKRFLAEARGLPVLRVTRADLSTVHRLADGTLSPLEGPMDGDTWHEVLEHQRIHVDGRPYAWTIPLSLPASEEEAASISRGASVAVCDESGDVVAILDEAEVFDWDKGRSRRCCTRSTASTCSPRA
jgi:sulfate adenylyltransferase